jgi:hypothetical protein
VPYNGAGVFTRIYNWVTDRNANVKIQAVRMDAEMDGFATGLSNCITKDGQTTVTANIPFNNQKITGLGDATTGTDALNRQTADARFVRYDASQTLSGGNKTQAYDNLGFSTVGKALVVATDEAAGRTAILAAGTTANNTFTGTALFQNTLSVIPTSGTATVEIGAPDGAQIDLKAPGTDDFDMRLSTTGTGGTITVPASATFGVVQNASTRLSLLSGGTWEQAATSFTGAVSGATFTVTGASSLLEIESRTGSGTGTWSEYVSTRQLRWSWDGTTGAALGDKLTLDDTGLVTFSAPPRVGTTTGMVVQTVSSTPYTTNTDLTTVIPNDNTIPQITEGVQILTLTITPTSTSSKIRLVFQGTGSSTDVLAAALFRTGTADALAADVVNPSSGTDIRKVGIDFIDSPASTSALTYSVRVGPATGGTVRMNGNTSGRSAGGVMACTLVAMEIRG